MGASLRNIFHPGNPERRRKLVIFSQRLYDYMKSNVRATNALSKFLKFHIKDFNLDPISLDENQTLKDNCDVLIARIKVIQDIVGKVNEPVREKLDPELYSRLANKEFSFSSRIQIAANVLYGLSGNVSTTGTIVVCVAIVSGAFLEPIVAAMDAVANSAIAGAPLSVLGGMALDATFQAITGAVQGDGLEEKIKELEEALATFSPASENYTDAIWEVLAELRIHTSTVLQETCI